ncbi:MAG: AMP-binding protein [Rickettsiales bacterium]
MLKESVIRPALTFLLKKLYRIKIIGLENFEKTEGSTVIIANHQSFVDPLFLSVFLPDKVSFAMNVHQARKWYFRWIDLIISTYKIDPLAPMSLKTLINDVKNGGKIVIFPEGRITTTGGIMKIYDGTGKIIEKTGATLLPIYIDGTEYSKVSRMSKKLRTHFFPQVTINILPPQRFAEGGKRSSLAIYDILANARFLTSQYKTSIISAMLKSAGLNGMGSKVATDINRNMLSYRQIFTRSFILADKLAPRLDGQKNVALMLPNMLGALVSFTALQILGKTIAMLNFSAGEKSISHACNIAQINTIITSREFIEKGKLEKLIETLGQKYTVIYLEDIRHTITIGDKLKAAAKGFTVKSSLQQIISETDSNSPAVILFTSGSEGAPKGVALSHENILSNIYQANAVLDLTSSDILFNAMPVFHCFGLTIGMLLPLVRGVKLFLYPSPVHYRIVPEIIYDCDATIMLGTDTFFNGYARYAHPYDFYSVRMAVAGAEKLNESTRRLYADKFNVNIMQGYGVTEASPVISFNTLMNSKIGSVGRAFPQIECKLEPVSGLEYGGKLLIKAPNVMLGYMKADAPGEIQKHEGWYDTGDIVEIDDSGFITIVGRAKRFAKIAGEMVSLALAEDLAVHLHPEQAHAAISAPDERKGEHIILYSEHTDITKESLIAAAKEKGIPEIALPKKILHIAEMPRLGTGKIDYPELTRQHKEKLI